MKATAEIEADGRLVIDGDVMRDAGFLPGDRIAMMATGRGLHLMAERNITSVFEEFRGIDGGRPPMSLDEIVAEQREMLGYYEVGSVEIEM